MIFIFLYYILIRTDTKFKKIIDKAKISCENSNISIFDCFTDVGKPIISGKGKKKIIKENREKAIFLLKKCCNLRSNMVYYFHIISK